MSMGGCEQGFRSTVPSSWDTCLALQKDRSWHPQRNSWLWMETIPGIRGRPRPSHEKGRDQASAFPGYQRQPLSVSPVPCWPSGPIPSLLSSGAFRFFGPQIPKCLK